MILMDPDSRFQMYRHWSMLRHIDHNNRGTSLLELLTGEEPADSKSSADDAARRAAKIVLTELGHSEKDVNLVPKEVGFMMRYRGGKASLFLARDSHIPQVNHFIHPRSPIDATAHAIGI